MSEKKFEEVGLGNSGGWTREQLDLIPEYKRRFVDGLAQGLFPGEIADSMDLTTALFRTWRSQDRDFDEACFDAIEQATDAIEKEAIRRAKDGVLDYVVAGGRLVMDPSDATKPLMRRKYSDGLMEFILKGRRRATYGDRQVVDQNVSVSPEGLRNEIARKLDSLASTGTAPAVPGDAERG